MVLSPKMEYMGRTPCTFYRWPPPDSGRGLRCCLPATSGYLYQTSQLIKNSCECVMFLTEDGGVARTLVDRQLCSYASQQSSCPRSAVWTTRTEHAPVEIGHAQRAGNDILQNVLSLAVKKAIVFAKVCSACESVKDVEYHFITYNRQSSLAQAVHRHKRRPPQSGTGAEDDGLRQRGDQSVLSAAGGLYPVTP